MGTVDMSIQTLFNHLYLTCFKIHVLCMGMQAHMAAVTIKMIWLKSKILSEFVTV